MMEEKRPVGRPRNAENMVESIPESENKQKIYWSTAKGHQIANFRKEIKQSGHIIQSEVPLKFLDHVYIANDSKEAEFVEASPSFANGRVRKVKDLAEANALTLAVRRTRQIRTIESSYIDEGNVVYEI